MDVYHIIKRPLVTEKGTHQASHSFAATRSKPARGGSFTFEVHADASKPMIKKAVEEIYSVKVLSVRTSKRHGKLRAYRGRVGKTRGKKRAIVVLHADHHIDLF